MRRVSIKPILFLKQLYRDIMFRFIVLPCLLLLDALRKTVKPNHRKLAVERQILVLSVNESLFYIFHNDVLEISPDILVSWIG